MTDLFVHGEGTVVRIQDISRYNPTIGLISIPGITAEGEGAGDLPVIILEVEGKFSTSQNFTRSLKDVTYVLPFGDLPSEISLSCLIFAGGCSLLESGDDSIATVMDYYKDNRITRDSVEPIEIVYAGQRINGFITKLTMGAATKVGNTGVTFANFKLLGWFIDE